MIKYGKEWQVPVFSEEEGKRRHRLIRELMDYRGLQCLVIAGHTGNYKAQYGDLRYVTQFNNWFDDEYCVFPLDAEPVLYVWMLQHKYWAEKVSWVQVENAGAGLGMGLGYIVNIVNRIKELELESANIGIVNMRIMPAYVYEGIRELLPAAKFVEAGDILYILRRNKSAEELEFVRKAGECADIGFRAMAEVVKPGVTDHELAAACESAMIKAGAEVGSFTLFNSKQWPDGWGLPYGGTNRKLQKGDVILNEITPCFGGYYVQLCRPISIGEPSADFLELFKLYREMYLMARNMLRPGAIRSEIKAKVSEFAKSKRNLSFVDAGLQGLDGIACPEFRAALAASQVFVIHPWANPPETDIQAVKGHMGHIIGDTCIVTEGEAESVCKLPLELTVV